jgi:carbamoyltransferase
MQYTSRCKYPDQFPAIVHADGTSRVQTVTKEQHPGLYRLLERWLEETGCPMLLNTSLNIKGFPMVNNRKDADMFYGLYRVKVF